ncbi:uncharacterized protein LOC121971709 [Zingiber officinale]|uniref:uncharacterized protein LOC121971709 n=1 Tax=Zingiber officinale TaxID=94328 RepID=UPI001C4D7E0A|nr:uncharacterized protein LOC121971709 [Zingiber officinale]
MMQLLRGWRSYSRCGVPPPLRRPDGFSVMALNQRPGRFDHWRPASSSNGGGRSDDERSSGRKLLLLPRLVPPRSSFSSWAKWLIGSALALLIPLWKKGWPALLRIEEEVEKVADAAEVAAEVVEQIAGVVEKVSSEVAEKLPEESKLKGAVLLVEQVSKEAAEEAQAARDIIHKVNEVRQEVEKITLDAGKEDHKN